ncbi:MAG TPA: carboxypeptidase regulatory-like domain-containing protein, partial [Gemmatimonadales bacterium]|nr:carboxypeptidase regulatory-like domain-containing protein [Gemmatimonadales bacterium]
MLAALLALALAAGDVTGAVSDSANGKPLGGADVLVSRSGQVVSRTSTDAFGRYRIHDLSAGTYQLEVRMIGFRPQAKQIEVAEHGEDIEVVFQLSSAPVELQTIEVSGAPVAVDTRTGNQVFKQ